jgi:hypothetical protein
MSNLKVNFGMFLMMSVSSSAGWALSDATTISNSSFRVSVKDAAHTAPNHQLEKIVLPWEAWGPVPGEEHLIRPCTLGFQSVVWQELF